MEKIYIWVYIKNMETGQVVKHLSEAEITEDDPNTFIWEEGNYSCDCNRGIFFGDYLADEEGICGDSKYKIRIEALISGELLYQDEEYGSN